MVGSIVLGYTPPESGANPHFYLGIGLALVAALGWGIEGVIATFGMVDDNQTFDTTTTQVADTMDLSFLSLPVVLNGTKITPWAALSVVGRDLDFQRVYTYGNEGVLDSNMTERYSHLSPDKLRRAVKTLEAGIEKAKAGGKVVRLGEK